MFYSPFFSLLFSSIFIFFLYSPVFFFHVPINSCKRKNGEIFFVMNIYMAIFFCKTEIPSHIFLWSEQSQIKIEEMCNIRGSKYIIIVYIMWNPFCVHFLRYPLRRSRNPIGHLFYIESQGSIRYAHIGDVWDWKRHLQYGISQIYIISCRKVQNFKFLVGNLAINIIDADDGLNDDKSLFAANPLDKH